MKNTNTKSHQNSGKIIKAINHKSTASSRVSASAVPIGTNKPQSQRHTAVSSSGRTTRHYRPRTISVIAFTRFSQVLSLRRASSLQQPCHRVDQCHTFSSQWLQSRFAIKVVKCHVLPSQWPYSTHRHHSGLTSRPAITVAITAAPCAAHHHHCGSKPLA